MSGGGRAADAAISAAFGRGESPAVVGALDVGIAHAFGRDVREALAAQVALRDELAAVLSLRPGYGSSGEALAAARADAAVEALWERAVRDGWSQEQFLDRLRARVEEARREVGPAAVSVFEALSGTAPRSEVVESADPAIASAFGRTITEE